MRFTCFYFIATCLGIFALASNVAVAKEVEQKSEDGKLFARYNVDGKSRKSGEYIEYFPGGKRHIRGNYRDDKKDGQWTIFFETGKTEEIQTYQADHREGAYQYNFANGLPECRCNYHNDEIAGVVSAFDQKGNSLFNLNYPLAWDDINQKCRAWSPAQRSTPKFTVAPKLDAPHSAGVMAMESQEAALKYMMLFRYLAGLPTNGMSIDPGYADKAQHGAVILHELGHLSHTPDRPADMDESFFKLAYAGTSSSNISQGRDNLFDSIDDYMDDSDAGNVQRVGHRQWILNPPMRKSAFGYADHFSTLYAFDNCFDNSVKWLYIAYPSPGYYPHNLLRDSAAWSLSLNTQKCKLINADLRIEVSQLDEHFAITQEH